jgi:hypothetical protein
MSAIAIGSRRRHREALATDDDDSRLLIKEQPSSFNLPCGIRLGPHLEKATGIGTPFGACVASYVNPKAERNRLSLEKRSLSVIRPTLIRLKNDNLDG